jgi:cobalt/nickel transport system permease protein
MHIPDGFLDAKTSLATGALAITGLGFALRHTRKTLLPRKIPLLGLAAAFVFAAQMINFPVAGGTSGHLLGGVLAAALLGPSAAVIVLSAVLIVQCLMFADGGITALGANIFNMAILGGAIGGILYHALARVIEALLLRILPTNTSPIEADPQTRLRRREPLLARLAAAALASWAAVMLASLAATGELASSNTVPWHIALPAMTATHALIGIGEALITTLVLSAIAAARPDLVLQSPSLRTQNSELRTYTPLLVFGLLATLGLTLFLSPFASQLPDGLDYVAEKIGFVTREQGHLSLFASYTAWASAVVAVTMFFFIWLFARLFVVRPKANS